jgi:phosphoenolpyruvate carboxykinase (ATP)
LGTVLSSCDFQFQCPDVFDFGLQWSDKKAYQDALLKLGGLFNKNFETFTSYKIGKDNKLTEEILAAGPIF